MRENNSFKFLYTWHRNYFYEITGLEIEHVAIIMLMIYNISIRRFDYLWEFNYLDSKSITADVD
jgi:hypothetical protein